MYVSIPGKLSEIHLHAILYDSLLFKEFWFSTAIFPAQQVWAVYSVFQRVPKSQ